MSYITICPSRNAILGCGKTAEESIRRARKSLIEKLKVPERMADKQLDFTRTQMVGIGFYEFVKTNLLRE